MPPLTSHVNTAAPNLRLRLRTCFIELQAWEQTFEPGLLAPEEAADPYLVEGFQELR